MRIGLTAVCLNVTAVCVDDVGGAGRSRQCAVGEHGHLDVQVFLVVAALDRDAAPAEGEARLRDTCPRQHCGDDPVREVPALRCRQSVEWFSTS